MADTLPDDPELSLAIEQALAPFVGVLPAATLDHMRREMAIQLGAHPHTAAMLRQLRPDPVVQKSGTVVEDEVEPTITNGSARPATSGRRGGQ
jgi:hypothetical protein